MVNTHTYAVWKRKTASAQVRLFDGKGDNIINWRNASEYITRDDLFDVLYSPLKLLGLKDSVHFEVKVSGSGESAQAQAIAHAISKALVEKDESNKTKLRSAGHITRDARKVERKKPGLHKARKAIQWSKR